MAKFLIMMSWIFACNMCSLAWRMDEYLALAIALAASIVFWGHIKFTPKWGEN